VDGDRAHAEKRQRSRELAGIAQIAVKMSRFLNVGEIRFSVRSALKHMPWIAIFIVTDLSSSGRHAAH
jgi:hypothetical protein